MKSKDFWASAPSRVSIFRAVLISAAAWVVPVGGASSEVAILTLAAADGGHEDGGGRGGSKAGGEHSEGGSGDHDSDSGTHSGGSGGHSGGAGGQDGGSGDHDGGSGEHDGGSGGHGADGGVGHGATGKGAGGSGKERRPVWAQEGIPEVELGRLNVIRSPDRVLERAYSEALAIIELEPETAAFYRLSFDDMKTALTQSFDEQDYIDSPLQNLALLRDALSEERSVLATKGVTTLSDEELAAVFLGLASDKTIPVTTETVVAVTRMLGVEVGEASEELARKAEEIRAAVAAGHG